VKDTVVVDEMVGVMVMVPEGEPG
jgi:hypothetical protein